jgi:DNA-binding NtrC family response regulator
MGRILVVDDDEDLRTIVREVLKDGGFSVTEAKDGLSGMKLFKADIPDAVLIDLKMPHMDGIETMKGIRKIDPNVPVIILTGHGDIPTAVEAIKSGAYDFVSKPPEFDRLIVTLRRAIERRSLQKEVERANTAFSSSLEIQFGKSDAIETVIGQIRQIAGTDFSVIIQGETGTGKSVVAGAIQGLSPRADKPFVNVDIGLIPDHLVESELFGYKKGAFTGAERDKVGYFETANRGTIFVDELENMSPHVQAKMLSFIEKKKIYPLGGTTPVDLDVRIIAATNKDIKTCVRMKEFREDLFYRLGEFIITLPPLRERADDIPLFAQRFVFEAATELNRQIRGIADDGIALLLTHSWPGNLRELKNVMRKATLLTEEDIIHRECIASLIAEQSADKSSPSAFSPLREAVKELERKLIREALEKTRGNITRAAKLLDVSYKNLYDKIKEYNLKGRDSKK